MCEPHFCSEVWGNRWFSRKASGAASFSALYFLLNFLVLTVSCHWHQQFHFKWSFNIDIPPCLPFFLGLTFAWQMVQMVQQIFTGSVLEKQRKAKQSKTKQKHPSCQTDDFLAPYYVPPVNRMGKTPQEDNWCWAYWIFQSTFWIFLFEAPPEGKYKDKNFSLSFLESAFFLLLTWKKKSIVTN